MSELQFVQITLGLSSLLLPLLLFVVANPFRSQARVALRALVATAAGWSLVVVYAIVVRAMIIAISSPDELLRLYDRDGAPLTFAALLGWLPAALIVSICWFVRVRADSRRKRDLGALQGR